MLTHDLFETNPWVSVVLNTKIFVFKLILTHGLEIHQKVPTNLMNDYIYLSIYFAKE